MTADAVFAAVPAGRDHRVDVGVRASATSCVILDHATDATSRASNALTTRCQRSGGAAREANSRSSSTTTCAATSSSASTPACSWAWRTGPCVGAATPALALGHEAWRQPVEAR